MTLPRVQNPNTVHVAEDYSIVVLINSKTTKNFPLNLQSIRKSKWTPPEGQFASLDFFIKKCRHDINKLNFNRSTGTKFSNLYSEEWSALKSLRKRKDIVIRAADKGGALVVWRTDLYQKEALRQLSDTSFYQKISLLLTNTPLKIGLTNS